MTDPDGSTGVEARTDPWHLLFIALPTAYAIRPDGTPATHSTAAVRLAAALGLGPSSARTIKRVLEGSAYAPVEYGQAAAHGDAAGRIVTALRLDRKNFRPVFFVGPQPANALGGDEGDGFAVFRPYGGGRWGTCDTRQGAAEEAARLNATSRY